MDVQTPEPPGRFSLRLDVYSPPQVLQIDGRLCHLVLAFLVLETLQMAGPLGSTALRRFIATTDPAATLSSSADFPVLPIIRPTLLRRFLVGTRRASPVAWHVLVTVLSLPPRQGDQPRRSDFGCSCCLSPTVAGSALGDIHFRGHNAFTFVTAP